MPNLTLLFLLVSILVYPPAPSVAESMPSYRLFVTNYRDDTVSVIDGDARREEHVLEVGGTPQGLAHRTNPPLVAIANSTADHVTLIDPVAPKVIGRIETGAEPEDVVFSRDGRRLYATSAVTRAVHVLDVEKGQEISRFPAVPTGRPVRLALSPDGKRLYVLVRSKPGLVQVYDLEKDGSPTSIEVGERPNDFGLSADGRRLIVSVFTEDHVEVIDTSSLEVTKTYPLQTGAGLIVHPTEPWIYSLASYEHEIVAADYESGARLGSAELGQSPQYGTMSPSGDVLFVAFEDSNRIAAVDPKELKLLWRLGVGEEPADIEYVALGPPPSEGRSVVPPVSNQGDG